FDLVRGVRLSWLAEANWRRRQPDQFGGGIRLWADRDKRRVARLKFCLASGELSSDSMRVRTADSNDADSTSTRRSGNCNDRVDGREHSLRLLIRDVDRLRKRVANALRRHAGNSRGGEVNDSALVWVERPQLLIDAGVSRLLREKLRHPPELDVFAFSV